MRSSVPRGPPDLTNTRFALSPRAAGALDSADSASWTQRDPQVAACMQHGGFIRDAEWFDNARYGISAVEAGSMDPQQRLLLEHGEAALLSAGAGRDDLMGSSVGVFTGIAAADWLEILQGNNAMSIFAATGTCVLPRTRS